MIILAFVIFPMKMPFYAEPIEPDYYAVGWLFSPVIGTWGLASIVLGLIQSSLPKRRTVSYLAFIFALILTVLTYLMYLIVAIGSGIIRSLLQGGPIWLLYLSLITLPSIILIALTIMYLRRKEEKGPILMSKRVKVTAFTTTIAVPLLYSVAVFYYLNL